MFDGQQECQDSQALDHSVEEERDPVCCVRGSSRSDNGGNRIRSWWEEERGKDQVA